MPLFANNITNRKPNVNNYYIFIKKIIALFYKLLIIVSVRRIRKWVEKPRKETSQTSC